MSDLKCVKIVIQETGETDAGGDKKFDVFMEGDIQRIGKIPKMELGTAEFWGSELFRICRAALEQCGGIARRK